jgi:hypothetical protein
MTEATKTIQAREPIAFDWIALGAALVTVVLWASAFVGIRAVADDLSPGALAVGRLLVGSLALGVVVVRSQPHDGGSAGLDDLPRPAGGHPARLAGAVGGAARAGAPGWRPLHRRRDRGAQPRQTLAARPVAAA